MQNLQTLFDRVDLALTTWMAEYGIVLLRISLGIVFLWFGALKFFPGLSSAQELATRTIDRLSFGLVPPNYLGVYSSLMGMRCRPWSHFWQSYASDTLFALYTDAGYDHTSYLLSTGCFQILSLCSNSGRSVHHKKYCTDLCWPGDWCHSAWWQSRPALMSFLHKEVSERP